MKTAAGILLHRQGPHGVEVLLVHPSGWYNRTKPWSIPKGELDPEENLEATARRETLEETGIRVEGPLTSLGTVRYQKSGKTIHGFASAAPEDAEPKCASWEVDRVEFLSLEEARKMLHPDQIAFLDRFAATL